MIRSKLIFGLFFLNAANLYALDAPDIFKKVSPSVVVIKTPNAQGSGVATRIGKKGLTPNTYIISNCHVVNGEASVIVERLGKSTIGKVIFCDAERDVALITIGGELPVVEERTTKIEIGERVYAVGSPQGLELSISEGVVSQLRTSQLGKQPMIQTTAAISPGSSGGGLFDQQGKLVGITTLMLKNSQSLNFAMPPSFVDESIEANKNNSTRNQEEKNCSWAPFDNRRDIYYDVCSIAPYRDYKSIWLMRNSEKSKKNSSGSYYSSSMLRYIADCSTQTVAIKSLVEYEKPMGNGNKVNNISLEDDRLKFEDAVPNSLTYEIIKTLCLP